MIVELIVGLIAGLLEFIGGLFGSWSMPAWWSEVDNSLDFISDQAAGFGQWIPFSAVVQALNLVVVAVGLALVIKLVRIVASFFTAGGGSAA